MKKSNEQKSTPTKKSVPVVDKIDTSKIEVVSNPEINTTYSFTNEHCTKPHQTIATFCKKFVHPTTKKSLFLFAVKNNIFYVNQIELKAMKLKKLRTAKPVFLTKNINKHLSKHPVDQCLVDKKIVVIADAI